MAELKIGYARVSTAAQELTAQRNALQALGVEPERIYVDHGLIGTNPARPGLREALAACRSDDMLVVAKLARSLPSQERHLGQLHRAGEKNPAELAELFGVGRSTVYRASDRARDTPGVPVLPAPSDDRPAAVAVILAGGRSRRMGTPKAGVVLDGRTLLDHAVAAAREAGLRPLVVAKRGSVLPDVPGLERWDEPDDPVHPLAGVAHALRRAEAPVVVLPVDLPRVPPALLRHLADRSEPLVVVEAAGRLHPLLGRFTPGCAGVLDATARDGGRTVAAVRALGAATADERVVAAFGDPARLLANVNRPEDLA